jgi:hypothetical protein
MKEYFKEQLGKVTPITQEKLRELKGKSYYSEYQEGDLLAAFMEQEFGIVEEPYTEPSITFNMHVIVERDMSKLKEDFKFIRIAAGDIPVLERIEK